MKKEQLISDLKEMLGSDEKYSFLELVKNNIGVFLTMVSLVAALLVFGAKISIYLVDSVRCQYWNLDEGFIAEDDKAYLKLGVFIIIILVLSISNVTARKYADLWEVYNCQFFLLTRSEKQQKKRLRLFEKEIKTIEKGIDLAEKAESVLKQHDAYPFKDAEVDDLRDSYNQIKKDIQNMKNEHRELKRIKLKWKWENTKHLGLSFFVTVIASCALQNSICLNVGDNSLIRMIQSGLVLALIMFAGVLLNSWVNIKFKFKYVINSFLKENDATLDSECKIQIMNLLESKANMIRDRDRRQYLSDKSCKNMLQIAIYYVVVAAILLPNIAKYNLCHLDTFYVVKEEMKNYVLVAKFGDDFILTQCDILDEELFIDTNRIYVAEEPIKMEKTKFKRVEKR